jgi:CheY-like chemotaxis protein
MGQPRVLIVDDSRMSRMLIVAIVEEVYPDADIVEASSGEDALELCQGQGLDIASIDLNMPGMDGLSVAKVLRADFPAAKLALMTASLEADVRAEADSLGLDFIAKPITVENLSAFLQS